MRYFFLDIDSRRPPAAAEVLLLSAEESHHLQTVLRGGRNEVLHLLDGHGRRYTAVGRGRQGERMQVEILTVELEPQEQAPPQLHLVCAVVKGRRFEWVLEKGVELGAHGIWPLVTDHGVVRPGAGKAERWLTIMKSAAKQCGRPWLPRLDEAHPLERTLPELATGLLFFGVTAGEWEGRVGPVASLLDMAGSSPRPLPARLTLLIGPEGGWSPAEVDRLLAAGARPVSLGPYVLRTETAAAAGLALLQAVRQAWLTDARP